MVVNIISNQVEKNKIRGPKKVLDNLLKGLDLIGVQYVLNQPMSKFKYNWIQDSKPALIEATLSKIPVLLGPNVVEVPSQLPFLRQNLNKDSIYLQPSKWAKDVWLNNGFNECRVEEWAVGIDTDLFHQIDRSNISKKVLVYFKQRKNHELSTCVDLLSTHGINFSVLKYGDYNENQFIDILKECTLCIWIGCDESQGIGLQEILSTNMPIIVIKDTNSKFKFYDSSPAPYFDNSCGIILDKIDELSEDLIKNFDPKDFTPRKYIVNNLSLEISAKMFVDKLNRIKVKKTLRFNLKYLCYLIYLIELALRKSTYKSIVNKIFK